MRKTSYNKLLLHISLRIAVSAAVIACVGVCSAAVEPGENGIVQVGDFVLLDGTNASDDIADRPGWKALQEEGVLSPLQLCGLTKGEIRRLSKEAGLFTASKPAYACLATRIPCGEAITREKLAKVEAAESELFTLGFRDFRVRTPGGAALVQVTADQTAEAHEKWDAIRGALSPYFTRVELDAKGRSKSL